MKYIVRLFLSFLFISSLHGMENTIKNPFITKDTIDENQLSENFHEMLSIGQQKLPTHLLDNPIAQYIKQVDNWVYEEFSSKEIRNNPSSFHIKSALEKINFPNRTIKNTKKLISYKDIREMAIKLDRYICPLTQKLIFARMQEMAGIPYLSFLPAEVSNNILFHMLPSLNLEYGIFKKLGKNIQINYSKNSTIAAHQTGLQIKKFGWINVKHEPYKFYHLPTHNTFDLSAISKEDDLYFTSYNTFYRNNKNTNCVELYIINLEKDTSQPQYTLTETITIPNTHQDHVIVAGKNEFIAAYKYTTQKGYSFWIYNIKSKQIHELDMKFPTDLGTSATAIYKLNTKNHKLYWILKDIIQNTSTRIKIWEYDLIKQQWSPEIITHIIPDINLVCIQAT